MCALAILLDNAASCVRVARAARNSTVAHVRGTSHSPCAAAAPDAPTSSFILISLVTILQQGDGAIKAAIFYPVAGTLTSVDHTTHAPVLHGALRMSCLSPRPLPAVHVLHSCARMPHALRKGLCCYGSCATSICGRECPRLIPGLSYTCCTRAAHLSYSELMNSSGRSAPSLMPRLFLRKAALLILFLTCAGIASYLSTGNR